MSDEYVQSHTTLLGDPKIRRLGRELGIGTFMARAHMQTLWLNCLLYAADGDLEDLSNEDIAFYAEWCVSHSDVTVTPCDVTKDAADAFVDAVVRCRLLDRGEHGQLLIHGWAERSGGIKKAEARAAARDRKRNERARKATLAASEPAAVEPCHSDSHKCHALTEQNRTELNRTNDVDARATHALAVVPVGNADVVPPPSTELVPTTGALTLPQVESLGRSRRWRMSSEVRVALRAAYAARTPITRSEFDEALRLTVEQAQTPCWGFWLRKLEFLRSPQARAPPPLSREGQAIKRSIECSMDGMFDGVMDIPGKGATNAGNT